MSETTALRSTMIDLDALRLAPVHTDPFPWFMVPNFIKPGAIAAAERDFPQITLPGSLPLPSLHYGPAFGDLMQQIRGPEMTALMAEKLNINLDGRPTMLTVRGQCRPTDGKIHTDSVTKLVTVLIYMNGQWEAPGGRLRLLRGSDDINNYVAEVPPNQGTLLAFRNQADAWHGHESFAGQRRTIQLNWVRDRGVVWREQWRHRLSVATKRFFKMDAGY